MTIETSLYTTLTGDAGVSALVGSRVSPAPVKEGVTYPFVSYQMIFGGREPTLPGTGNPTRKRIQINCNARTYSEAKSLAAAVVSALEGDGYMDSEADLYDSETQTHTVAIDWSFMAV